MAQFHFRDFKFPKGILFFKSTELITNSKEEKENIEHTDGSFKNTKYTDKASSSVCPYTANDSRAFEEALAVLYPRMIEQNFQGEPGTRNAFIVKRVPFLYSAVTRQLIIPLLLRFYDEHRQLFNDTRERHVYEIRAMLKGVASTFLSNLTEEEQRIYDSFGEILQTAMRICRSLANCPKNKVKGTFCLSCRQLRHRLCLRDDRQAHKLLKSLCGTVIELVKTGDRYSPEDPDKKLQASEFKYLL